MRHIFVHRRNRDGVGPDWIAYFAEDRNAFEVGNTQAEAVGKLVLSHPNTFNISAHETYERHPEHYY